MAAVDLEKLRELGAPAIHLMPGVETDGFSRIGGEPQLPEDFTWPHWKEAPLAFLAQIDLAELPADADRFGLPDTGCLWFFYVADQSTWGFDPADAGSWHVAYRPQRPHTDRTELPADLPQEGEIGEVPLVFREITVYPSIERIALDVEHFNDKTWGALEELFAAPFGGMPRHQMGGFPGQLQGDTMELECQLVSHGLYCGDGSGYTDPRAAELEKSAGAWQLLLQLDTDDDAGMMWGDCGRLYFWIHRDDLARRDFSRVWMILQCS